jgi:hypothetical protein
MNNPYKDSTVQFSLNLLDTELINRNLNSRYWLFPGLSLNRQYPNLFKFKFLINVFMRVKSGGARKAVFWTLKIFMHSVFVFKSAL